jgi:hypothetical protein
MELLKECKRPVEIRPFHKRALNLHSKQRVAEGQGLEDMLPWEGWEAV